MKKLAFLKESESIRSRSVCLSHSSLCLETREASRPKEAAASLLGRCSCTVALIFTAKESAVIFMCFVAIGEMCL